MKKLIKCTLAIILIATTSLNAQVKSKRGGHYNSHYNSHSHSNYSHHRPNNAVDYLLPLIIGNIVYNLAAESTEENYAPCPYKDYVWVKGYWRAGLLNLRWHWVEGYWQKRRVRVDYCVCGNYHH